MSRAALVGACYGAMHGRATETNALGVPHEWVSLLNNGVEELQAIKELVQLRAELVQDSA